MLPKQNGFDYQINNNNNKNNDEQKISLAPIIKKRGRPRKNNIQLTQNDIELLSKPIEQDIIVYLPITKSELNSDNELSDKQELNINSNNNFEYVYNSKTIDTIKTINSNDSEYVLKLKNIINGLDEKVNKYEQELKKYNINYLNNFNKKINIYNFDNPFEVDKDNNIKIPNNCKLGCLWDTYKINDVPYFLPEKYENGIFHVIGWFCSLNCAVSYNLLLNDDKVSQRYSLLKFLYNKQNNIIPSPSFRILKKYGGIYTIEEYRKKLLQENREYRIISSPMTYSPITLEEKMKCYA